MDWLQIMWSTAYSIWVTIPTEIRVILLSLAAIVIWELTKNRLIRRIFRVVMWTIAVKAVFLWSGILIIVLAVAVLGLSVACLFLPLWMLWKLLGLCMTWAGVGDWFSGLSTPSEPEELETDDIEQ